jgi:hypothetical protein
MLMRLDGSQGEPAAATTMMRIRGYFVCPASPRISCPASPYCCLHQERIVRPAIAQCWPHSRPKKCSRL